jgi:microcystin-dependent protein
MKTYFTILLALSSVAASADESLVIPYQGQLADQSGQPLTPGSPVTILFRLYQTPVGGVAMWEEPQPSISVNAGRFSVLLGSRNALPAYTNFNNTLYLGLTVDDGDPQTTDVEMRPRQALVPVISASYAKQADNVDGYDWSTLFGSANPDSGTLLDSKIRDASITAAKILPGSITSKQIAAETIAGTNIAPNTISSGNVIPGSIDLTALAQSVIEALNPAGSITAFAGDVIQVPSGWLPCDGRALSSSDPKYTRLYQAISNNWGNGTAALGSTNDFNIPDLRGLFLRGVTPPDVERGIDPDKDRRVAMDTGQLVGPRVGTLQGDALRKHTHTIRWNGYPLVSQSDAPTWPPGFGGAGLYQDIGTTSWTADETGGLETRPVNAYVHYIIKY